MKIHNKKKIEDSFEQNETEQKHIPNPITMLSMQQEKKECEERPRWTNRAAEE